MAAFRRWGIVQAGFLALVAIALGATTAGAVGNAYGAKRAKSSGTLQVRDAADQSPLPGAYVATRNIPTSSGEFALRILAHGDGRRFGRSDTAGMASVIMMPLGSCVAWKPGYWPGLLEFRIGGSDSAVESTARGAAVMTLNSVPPSRGAEAAREAARLFGFVLANGKVRAPQLGVTDLSEKTREELRQVLITEGGLAAPE